MHCYTSKYMFLSILFSKSASPTCKNLDCANYIVKVEWNEDGAGKYFDFELHVKSIIDFRDIHGKLFMDCQAPGELYLLTGDVKYRKESV